MFDIKTIIEFLKKHVTRNDVILIVVLLGLFLTTRLVNLTQWPIFSDEGIYIRWAQVAWKDASWRFISVTDGRQPLQTWATIPWLKFFPDDALLAGRLFSVTTGLIALVGMFTLNAYLFGKKAAYYASILYIFMPYFVFYDRIALVDSAVNAGFIWILFFSILLVRTRRIDVAFALGFAGGFALLAKSSSRMFVMLSAGAIVLLANFKKLGESIVNSLNYLFLLGVAYGISLLFYNVQRLSPYFHYVEQKNTTFVMTFAEFMQTPLAYSHNFRLIPQYAAWEAGWLIVPISVYGLYKLYRKDWRLFLYLLAFIIPPYIAIGFFAKVLFPRYIIFYRSIFIITATYAFISIKKESIRRALFGILLLSMLILNYPLLFNPPKAFFPEVDRGQYVEGVTAVWGAEEMMEMLGEQSKERPILIMAEGNFGLVADVLHILNKDEYTIEVKGFWPLTVEHLYEYQPEIANRDVYVVYSHRTEFPDHWPIELVEAYEKPESEEKLYLFRLLPEEKI